ncbi:hypothetical protein J4421_04915 [Candidatus Woesearchaeota archaeon]|nr:hypothetical protein [Candidatus Woesearchaeota archaeon]
MSEKNKNLEEAIKEKVTPLLEESMEKNWGVSIPKLESDITDKLKKPLLDIYISLHKTYPEAKRAFKAEFLKKELKLHLGNVSQLAKTLGLDRRSIHRTMKDLDIDRDKLRQEKSTPEEYQEIIIDQTIRGTLEEYKEIILPNKMEKMYEDVRSLSRNIAKVIPHRELRWKEAEHEFEKVFLTYALKANGWKVSTTANKINLRVETLHRKAKKLGLRKD